MNSNPKVSIAINNYNYARFLSQAIDSALSQTYPHVEVIVVDDGSTDNSREVIASYGDKILPVLKENGGQASAFNAGFAASKGDIVCFLDADDTFVPEKAEKVVEALGDRPDLGWCFHPLKFVDEKLVEINDKKLKTSPDLFREYDLTQLTKSGRFYKNFPYPSTSGLCLKRSLLQQILPMPDKAGSTLLNDAFLIFSSLGLSKGIVLDKELSLYRVHGKNANAIGKETKGKSKDYQKRTAKINILLGYWIGVKFPSFYEFSNHMMATGMGVYLRNGEMDAEFKKLVKNHLATVKPIDKLKIYMRAFYNFLKNPKY
ncbi:glycosyltransferase [Trichocoleus sp. Lan]|uniref:glycosyltransferase family 2 protein n=1 Tax=Trichocoleus sp. Lan TaxID=2933927 RepID=UPI003299286F